MEQVKHHYNKTASNIRKNDDVGKVARVHNWVKAMLIEKLCSPDDTIIDIGCGRGGDVKKYKHSKIQHIIGIDLSDKSLLEMKKRCEKESLTCELICADACSVCLPTNVDGIVANFSLHYFFNGRENIIIPKIYNSLKYEGYFWGIVSNPKILTNKSDLFSVDITEKNKQYTSYKFTLGNAVSECVESVIHTEKFEFVCNMSGFKTILIQNLHDFICENKNSPIKQFFKVCQTYPEVHSVYSIFVFQKKNMKHDE